LSGNSEISAIRKQGSSEQQEEKPSEEETRPIETMKKKLKRLKTIILEKAEIGNHPDLTLNSIQ
jgi:hypothetical protein